jgi:hypothetical protein
LTERISGGSSAARVPAGEHAAAALGADSIASATVKDGGSAALVDEFDASGAGSPDIADRHLAAADDEAADRLDVPRRRGRRWSCRRRSVDDGMDHPQREADRDVNQCLASPY